MTSETPTDRAGRALALDAEATPEPWGVIPPGGPAGRFFGIWNTGKGWIVATQFGFESDGDANARLACEYRSLAPALARDVKALTKELSRVVGWLRRYDHGYMLNPSDETQSMCPLTGDDECPLCDLVLHLTAYDALREAEEVRE